MIDKTSREECFLIQDIYWFITNGADTHIPKDNEMD
jgi:hypothetical protein